MAEYTRWHRYISEEVVKLPNRRGRYEIAARNKVIVYRGGSDSDGEGVKGRLLSHLRANRFPTGYFFRCKYANLLQSGIELEAKGDAQHLKKFGKKPKYCQRMPKYNGDSPFATWI